MKQEALKNFDLPWLPLSALVIFMGCFVLYTWWTYRRNNKDLYEKAAQMPLQEASITNLNGRQS